jgi:hypothetical protein
MAALAPFPGRSVLPPLLCHMAAPGAVARDWTLDRPLTQRQVRTRAHSPMRWSAPGTRSFPGRGHVLAHIPEHAGRCSRNLGREPTPAEPAAELDMTPEKVIEVQKYGREPISLHNPLGEDGDSEFGDLIEDSEAIQPGEAVSFTLLQDQLHSVLDTLSEREARGDHRHGPCAETLTD